MLAVSHDQQYEVARTSREANLQGDYAWSARFVPDREQIPFAELRVARLK